MNASARIRVLIHCRGAGPDIFRTLVSLARQSVGAKRQNIILASTAPESFNAAEATLLFQTLNFNRVEVQDAAGMNRFAALNRAAQGADEATLALIPEGTRLGQRFLASCLEPLDRQGLAASFPLHTAGAPDAAPLARLRPFLPEQLLRANTVGPAALVRTEAWQALGGLRSGSRLAVWDFWLRLTHSGRGIARVQELLAHCRPLRRMPAKLDGQAKALLVTAAPGAFQPDTCRWALALLRGEAWAEPFLPGIIPSPHEVRAMQAEVWRSLRGRLRAQPQRQALRSA